MDIKILLIYVACIIGIMIIGKIFIIPIKIIIKLIMNSILGAILLYLINLIGVMWGLHIGINLITVIIVGVLGIPGAILLAILSIFL
ncbi:MAG: pro-sigmaK processing inhibitor BofA family protein [Clostridia bacterium]